MQLQGYRFNILMPHLVSFGMSFAATVIFLSDAFACSRLTINLDGLCNGRTGGRLLEVTTAVAETVKNLVGYLPDVEAQPLVERALLRGKGIGHRCKAIIQSCPQLSLVKSISHFPFHRQRTRSDAT